MKLSLRCWLLMERLLKDMQLHGFASDKDREYWAGEIMKVNRLATDDAWEFCFQSLQVIEERYWCSLNARRTAKARAA